jgi:hypothetical protein
LKPRGRRRLLDDLSVEEFIRRLNERGCRYAVLRWFESLPVVESGEDIDILVADADVESVSSLLTTRGHGPGTPCDCYSVSGLPKTAFRGVPYYTPKLAEGLLSRAQSHHSGALVPCPEDHFYSLAYHALYHKGLPSGLPPELGVAPTSTEPEHDYFATLTQLASDLGLELHCDMQSLDRALSAKGWRPPLDTLAKLGERNPWCRELVENALRHLPKIPGLTAFVVRERAGSEQALQEMTQLLERDGFHIVLCRRFDPAVKQAVSDGIRGATWGAGPFPVSGGGPVALIVALDIFPLAPSAKLAAQHSLADNAHVFQTKERVRRWWNDARPESEHCNVMHASDNARQAAHYVELAAKECFEQVQAAATAYLARVEQSDANVLRDLSNHGRRAKVELIATPSGGKVVRKTFRPGCERFLVRELEALEALAENDPEHVIPPLLATTRSSYTIPYYDDLWWNGESARSPGALWPLATVHRLFTAVRGFHERGYEFLDFGPNNVLLDSHGGIKLIDFEFAFCVPEAARTPFLESQTLRGPRPDWQGDAPTTSRQNWYERRWGRVTGLSLSSLSSGNPVRQRLERAAYQLRSAARGRYQTAKKAITKGVAWALE